MESITKCYDWLHVYSTNPNFGDRCQCGKVRWKYPRLITREEHEGSKGQVEAFVRRKAFRLVKGGKS